MAEALERCTSAPAATSASRCAARPCGSRSVPTRLTITGIGRSARAASMAGASRAAGSGSAPWPSTRSSRITPVAGSAAARASCSLRRVGSIIGCARPWVRASSPKSTIVWVSASRSSASRASSSDERDVAADRAEHLRSRSASTRRTACRRRRGRGAGVRSPRRCRRRPARARRGARGRAARARPRRRRSGRAGPRPSRPSSTGVARRVGVAGEGLGDLGCGRLGDHDDEVDVGVGIEAAQRLAGGETRRRRRTGRGRRRRARGVRRTAVPSCGARRRGAAGASSCWQPVPEAATRPIRPGRTALAKPSPTPSMTAVPQSGPITRAPREAAYVLSATSSATGTLSLKIITSWPASSASIASTVALAPGTETSTTRAGAPYAAGPTRSSAAGRRRVAGGRPGRGERGVDGCEGARARRRRPRGAARRPCRWGRSRARRSPCPRAPRG